VFINLMTTLPALILFVQYGLLASWRYFFSDGTAIPLGGGYALHLPVNPLLLGILGYGLVLTVCLSLLLLATATWLRKTVPMIMVWTTLFLFLRLLAASLVDGLHYDARWRLIDLWHSTYLVGNAMLGIPPYAISHAPQPQIWESSLVLGVVCLLCLTYLSFRIRAVEIVR
jgi:hypothetical protein